MRFKQNIISLIVIPFIIVGCENNKSVLDTEVTTNTETETTTQQVISTEQDTVIQTESIENSSTSKDDNIYYDLDIDELEKLANQGDAKAQFSLGRLYDRGEKVSQDYKKAFEWYTKAAEQGYIYAQHNLGVMYHNGNGISKDYLKAFELFSKAAEQGDSYAQNSLGIMYYDGKSVNQDYTKAFEWYTKAAEQGYATAQYNLGNMYYYGEGVNQDYTKAFELFSKAAEQGYAYAQHNLGNMYYNGEGVNQDYIKAFEWYTKAAEQDASYAQYSLGIMYYNGYGTQQNKQKGLEWINKSAEQGNTDAIDFLNKLNNETTTQPTTLVNIDTVNWDKCIQQAKDELISHDTGIVDIDIKVDTTKKQIDFNIVVSDTIEPESSLSIGDNVIRKFNSYAKEQDESIKSDDDSSYGGIYDTYNIVIAVSPLSEIQNIDNWYIYDYIWQGIPLKLQKQYR